MTRPYLLWKVVINVENWTNSNSDIVLAMFADVNEVLFFLGSHWSILSAPVVHPGIWLGNSWLLLGGISEEIRKLIGGPNHDQELPGLTNILLIQNTVNNKEL